MCNKSKVQYFYDLWGNSNVILRACINNFLEIKSNYMTKVQM